MRIIYSFLLLLVTLFTNAQTNPVAQAMPYSQDFSGLAASATTYPVGWQGWTISTAPGSAFNTATAVADRALIGSVTAAVNSGNINNYNGKIGFLNTGSLDLSLVVAVVTTGQSNIPVSYDVMTIRNPYDGGANTRVNEITLQYRVGTVGAFTNLTGIEYQNNTVTQTTAVTTPQNLVTKTLTLPAACDNQPVVQLRWASRQVSGAGARPSFAVDNISVGGGGADVTPPTVTTLTPADEATNVSISTNLSVAFSEAVQKGTGNILIKKLSDNSIVQTINVTAANVVVAGNIATITINPLVINTGYYVEIAAGAFKDLANNNFAGITGATTWNFATGTAIFTADFNTCGAVLTDGFSQFSLTGAQVWSCTTFGHSNTNPSPTASAASGVQINGFASGSNVINEDWLISPSLNLVSTTFPLLSFWSRTAFNGAPLKLRVSTNYSGTGNPSAATWIDLNGGFPLQTSDAWKLSQNINLSAYKTASTYIAFVYNSTDDDGARWTLDDIKIDNSPTPPPASLTPSTGEVNFGYVANGSALVKTMSFTGNDITAGVTLTATGNFLISKTNGSFTPSISYTQAEANNIAKTVFIQFTPTAPTVSYTGNLTISTATVADTIIILKGNSIDAASTLDVVNWNVEWFGSTTLGPTNDNLQEQNIKTILQNLNADVYALEEVVSEPRLANIVSQMPGYSYVLSNYGSYTNPNQVGAGSLADAQKLGLIYKTALFPGGVTSQALLSAGVNTAADITNPAYNWYASGRFPFMVTGTTTLNGVTKQIRFVITHAKANTSPTLTSYARRKAGNDSLRIHLNTFYPNDNIIFLGDFNDDLDSTITAGINPKLSSYKQFTDDVANFFSPTLALSLAGKKSTVSYNDVIDHVMVSNEMQCSYLPGSASIITDVTSLVTNYGSTTTDHYPVFTRYLFVQPQAATVSYAGSPYCANVATATPTLTGTTGGVYSSTTGLSINASTGVIDIAASTSGSYMVTYSLAANGVCNPLFSTTANVSINTLSVAPTSATANSTLVCANNGTVNLTANGGTLGASASYKWYSGSCGGILVGTGVTLTNVPISATTTYFVRIEGTCNTTACQSVTVNVAPQPVVEIAIAPATGITPAAPVTLIATVSPAGIYNYAWTKNNTTNLNTNADRILVSAEEAGNYKVRVTAASGCTATSTNAFVASAASTSLFISPNPNKGIFNVSYNNGTPNLISRTLNVFDSKGSRVFSQTYNNNVPFSFMKVDISSKGKGTYFVELIDATGKRLADGKVQVL
jgi:endonuclease/exonuclease/phosphatase family metal-dependent hydrolase